MHPPMSFWSEPPRPPPPPLETHFFEVLREVGGGGVGGGGGSKNDPLFFWVENHESFGFFFHFEPKKCFRVPTLWGLYGAEWDERYAV